jgi:hypothetical protein
MDGARQCFSSRARWTASLLGILFVVPLTACGPEMGAADDEGDELVGEAEDALVSGSVPQGLYHYFSFTKYANQWYQICINVFSGDADLYSHYTTYPTTGNYQYKSTNGGTSTDCVGFTAKETGTYYLSVYGFAPGSSGYSLKINGQ